MRTALNSRIFPASTQTRDLMVWTAEQGVTNMDTADAAGDCMFGMNQMLLPQLCPIEPDFAWCANRQYLSDGTASGGRDRRDASALSPPRLRPPTNKCTSRASALP